MDETLEHRQQEKGLSMRSLAGFVDLSHSMWAEPGLPACRVSGGALRRHRRGTPRLVGSSAMVEIWSLLGRSSRARRRS